MHPTIPLEVTAIARSYAGLDASAALYAVEITMGIVHREKPRLANALHLWRVDLPGHEAIEERNEKASVAGESPAYTSAMMSVFVVQLANGTYEADGALYDEDPE
jgi:hypothetical protein